jgi:hypothetical protein
MKPIVYYSAIVELFPSESEARVARLEKVFNHPFLGYAENVTTSRIVKIEGSTIETLNTIYKKEGQSIETLPFVQRNSTQH